MGDTSLATALGPGRLHTPSSNSRPSTTPRSTGTPRRLIPWQGRHVSVLVEPGVTRDPEVMTKLVQALDRAWSYYATTTGRLPATAHSSERPRRGRRGDEHLRCWLHVHRGDRDRDPHLLFRVDVQQIAENNLYDQIPFYELGRSFWFWSPQLQFHAPDQDPVVTGLRGLDALSLDGSGTRPGSAVQRHPVCDLRLAGRRARRPVRSRCPSLTFAGTLAIDKSPGLYGGTDFWASLMMQLAHRHGGQTFVKRFWQHAERTPGRLVDRPQP